MEVQTKVKPANVVYVQLRQSVRGKDGILKTIKTKVITVHNATIAQVEAALNRGVGSKG